MVDPNTQRLPELNATFGGVRSRHRRLASTSAPFERNGQFHSTMARVWPKQSLLGRVRCLPVGLFQSSDFVHQLDFGRNTIAGFRIEMPSARRRAC